ncbi:hypothetical protein [Arthrobacter sp. M4]|uniref:hypothetical protein n=1 Tax=Arthrobacter sp. M4 TaxID=218160 RepID=UPI001CDCA3B2|nr:hypothetical protein [Arthrobacter sp. M4]MCA4132467.1 hypothetical protein [Arthrobacter sp. M4]
MSSTSNQHTSTRPAVLAALGGSAAVLGGLLGAAAAYMESLAPGGCVGNYCSGGYRETTPQVAALALSSILLAAIGILGLAVLARARGRRYWMALTAAGLVAAGLLSLTAYSVFMAGTTNESWGWWAFGYTGFLAMWAGLVFGSIHTLVARVVPRWVGIAAIVASAVLPFFNTETAAVLVAVPAALAWALVGGFVVREALGDLDIGHRHAPALGA